MRKGNQVQLQNSGIFALALRQARASAGASIASPPAQGAGLQSTPSHPTIRSTDLCDPRQPLVTPTTSTGHHELHRSPGLTNHASRQPLNLVLCSIPANHPVSGVAWRAASAGATPGPAANRWVPAELARGNPRCLGQHLHGAGVGLGRVGSRPGSTVNVSWPRQLSLLNAIGAKEPKWLVSRPAGRDDSPQTLPQRMQTVDAFVCPGKGQPSSRGGGRCGLHPSSHLFRRAAARWWGGGFGQGGGGEASWHTHSLQSRLSLGLSVPGPPGPGGRAGAGSGR